MVAELADAGQCDGRGGQDAGPTGGRSASRIRRTPVWAHRLAHSDESRTGDCTSQGAEDGRPGFCRNDDSAQETIDGVKFFLDNPEAATKPNAAETWLLLRAAAPNR